MVRLDARGQPPGKPDGVAEARDHPAFRGNDDEVLVAADLCDRRGHLRGDAGRRGGERRGGRGIAEQPVAESSDRKVRDRREGGGIMGVDDEARHLVVLIGDDRLTEEMREWHVGERHLRCHPLLRGRGGNAGQAVARARRRRLGEQGFQIGEAVARPLDRDRVHRALSLSGRQPGNREVRRPSAAISEQANREVTIRTRVDGAAPTWQFAAA